MGSYGSKLQLCQQVVDHVDYLSSTNYVEDVQPEASSVFAVSTTMLYVLFLFMFFCLVAIIM